MDKLSIFTRSVVRRFGITSLIGFLRPARSYEDRFSDALFAELKQGDTVWDVGANVGLYTTKFCESVGNTGNVVAFEPNPTSAKEIQSKVDALKYSNVIVVQAALGNECGQVTMLIGKSDFAVDTRVVTGSSTTSDDLIAVDVYEGDVALTKFGLNPPDILKIDVEGFELECIQGLHRTLSSTKTRAVFVEVHFAVLESRGMRYAPLDIVKSLRSAGLVHCEWLDSSHLVARR